MLTPPAATNPKQRDFAIPPDSLAAVRERLAARADRYLVTHMMGSMPVTIDIMYQLAVPYWRITMFRNGDGAERVLNREGKVEWEPPRGERSEEYLERTRFRNLADVEDLLDRLCLWDAEWVQGRGWVSTDGRWASQDNHITLRVPDWV